MDQKFDVLPFDGHNKEVISSRKTDVLGFEDRNIILKVPKEGEQEFSSAVLAEAEIKKQRNFIHMVGDLVVKRGGKVTTILPQEAVVYKKKDGTVSYVRSQRYLDNSVTLSQMGKNVLGIDTENLKELKRIFEVNSDLWNTSRSFIDIVGSTTSKLSVLVRIFKHLLPLYYSENILLNDQGSPVVVDVGGIEGNDKIKFSTKLRGYLQHIGSELSLIIINRELKKRNL